MKNIDVLTKLMSKNADKRLKTNYRFVFKTENLRDKEFSSQVSQIYNDTGSKRFGDLLNHLADADMKMIEDYETYSNMFDFVKNKKGVSTQQLHKELYNVLEEQGLSAKQIEEHFKSLKDLSNDLGLDSDAFKFDFNSTPSAAPSPVKPTVLDSTPDADYLQQSEDYYRQQYEARRAREKVNYEHNEAVRKQGVRDQDLANKKAKEEAKEQRKFDEAWTQHLKDEEAKELDKIQRMYDAENVEAKYRADRQAELESVFANYEEPQITSGATVKEARAEAVQRRQAEQAAQDAVKQKEAARNSKIDGVVDDLFDVNANSHEAHSALNAMNRDGFFDSQADFETAKARLTAKYDAKPTRASIPRPGRDNLTKESYNRLKSKEIVTVKPGLEFKINTNAKGELSGIGSMRGGTAGELADATVGNPYFKQVFTGRNLGAVLNLGFAINDFNEARDAGDGVVKAAAKAGAQFVAGEMLGGWMFPVMLAKQAPTMAISAIEGTQKITRQMNSTGRMQTFGEAHFRDTQQLATMRQAGMELAKMSQYNLQQSMMGNEAQYMHRL